METTIGKIIYRKRKEKKLSRPALSELSGVSRASIQRYETTDAIPNLETLKKLVKALDISRDEFNLMLLDYNMFFDDIELKSENEIKRHYIDLAKAFSFDSLNSIGCKKAYEYVTDLAGNKKYQNFDDHVGIMNGEDLEKDIEDTTEK